ncbi:uncharacterized protein LOC111055866 [Nilaparvata lugens]|uniref:uncharacterized protein LOC111055866 n=1 Tax=Nilaparvata lugens TaxID=108931 RepID=UPI000B981071|nr:uncharacterized protein LOC111055866 [Nilaparvata lugens]
MGHGKRCIYLLAVFISTANAGLFFPEDLPTALNVAYSRIPAVRAGIDSRYGIGFRIGPNADLQLQWELGPQAATALLQATNQVAEKREAQTSAAKLRAAKSLLNKLTSSPSTPAPGGSGNTKRGGATTPDPDYGVKHLRKTILSIFADP